MKTTLILMLAGALAGIAVAGAAVPPSLAWYTAPGGLPQGASPQMLVDVPAVVRSITGQLIWWQEIGAGIGAALGLALGIMLGARGRKKREDAAATRNAASA